MGRDLLDLAEQVARNEQGGAVRFGQAAEQGAHVANAFGIEAVGRLVEDQQPRAAEQGAGDRQPLAHAERIAADALAAGAGQVDDVEHAVDLAAVEAEQPAGDVEILVCR